MKNRTMSLPQIGAAPVLMMSDDAVTIRKKA
jgi:hypothetical protein